MEARDIGPKPIIEPGGLDASFNVLDLFRLERRQCARADVPATGLRSAAGLGIKEEVISRLIINTCGPGRIIEFRLLHLIAFCGHRCRIGRTGHTIVVSAIETSRSEKRRVGKACVSMCGSGGSTYL